MRAVVSSVYLVALLLVPQKASDVYAGATAKYVAGDSDTAFDALGRLPQADIQREVETIVAAIKKTGGSTASRRHLEAMAMMHTDYALRGGIEPKGVSFHIDMAHLAFSVARLTLAGQEPSTRAPFVNGDARSGIDVRFEMERAREFIPHWTAAATSVVLTNALDQEAQTLVTEALKLLPDNEELLFWRGVVLEFQAVWIGEPRIDPRAALPAMGRTDGAGFDLLKNARIWGPVEEAYRSALARKSDDYEAHLHLGYALYSLRNYGSARTEYELARDRSTDPFVVYVGDLLLARMKEDQNDTTGAAQDYELALTKIPGAQSASIGLAMLEARRGNGARARELTTTLTAIPVRQRVRDPWWAYHTTRMPDRDLEWLRKAVRP
jgi:tetratricopeptide (TPR) repeat protein